MRKFVVGFTDDFYEEVEAANVLAAVVVAAKIAGRLITEVFSVDLVEDEAYAVDWDVWQRYFEATAADLNVEDDK